MLPYGQHCGENKFSPLRNLETKAQYQSIALVLNFCIWFLVLIFFSLLYESDPKTVKKRGEQNRNPWTMVVVHRQSQLIGWVSQQIQSQSPVTHTLCCKYDRDTRGILGQWYWLPDAQVPYHLRVSFVKPSMENSTSSMDLKP